jgi:hypothetical protein
MINNAIEREWPNIPQKESNILVQEMVQKGVWYLERVGDDITGMLDPTNLEEICKEDGRFMLSLWDRA